VVSSGGHDSRLSALMVNNAEQILLLSTDWWGLVGLFADALALKVSGGEATEKNGWDRFSSTRKGRRMEV